MKGGKAPLGYTIIEVLIVLAVSGLMFVIAANFIANKQGATAFTQGVNEMASRLQDTLTQVENGQYTDTNVGCQFVGGNTTFPPLVSGSQGTNTQCVFLGKMMHFQETLTSNPPAQQYEIFSIAGGRIDSSGHAVTKLVNADPGVVPNLARQETVPQHLNVVNIKINNVNETSFIIGFLQDLGSTDPTTDGDLLNGAQKVRLYYIRNFISPNPNPVAVANITGSNLYLAGQIDMCISDGQRNAVISFGTNLDSNLLRTKIKMLGGAPCP